MKRKICVITGTRADYGILHPVMKAIEASKDLSLYIIAIGMHLMKEFGFTVNEIKKDGFKVYKQVDTSYKEDTGLAMADSIGRAVSELSKTFAKLKPDIVVVLGDRGEMLAAAVAANYLNIPVAHLHGGEVSGHVDGLLRHAITKLAHIHLPATEKAKTRILKLGEEPWRTFVAGAPALDRILHEKLPKKKEVIEKYKINLGRPFLILLQHPVIVEGNNSAEQMKVSLEAIKGFNLQTMAVYPNADAGGRRMIDVIREYEGNNYIQAVKSIPHKDYLGLMKIASVLIGNSSSGIIEAPSFGLAAVNIGSRQNGRERGVNVIDVPHDKNAIIQAIKKALYDKGFRTRVSKGKNPYGDGNAAERIVKILSKIRLGKILLQKQMTY